MDKKVPYLDYFKDTYVYTKEKFIDSPEIRKIYATAIEELNDEKVLIQKIVDVVSEDDDAPIRLVKVQSLLKESKQEVTDIGNYLRTAWESTSDKKVSLICLEIICQNMYGNNLSTIRNTELDCNQDLQNAAKYGIKVDIGAQAFNIILKKVVFADESVWEGNKEFRVDLVTEEDKARIFYTFYHAEPEENK